MFDCSIDSLFTFLSQRLIIEQQTPQPERMPKKRRPLKQKTMLQSPKSSPMRQYFFGNYKFSLLERVALRIIKAGELPKHVALILDGNRRYARTLGQEPIWGHRLGFNTALPNAVDWCREIGVQQVTCYFLSTQNLKRSPVEVEGLMVMFDELFGRWCEEIDYFERTRMGVRILGNIQLLPEPVQRSIASLVVHTASYEHEFCINICIGYTGRLETVNAIEALRDSVQQGDIKVDDINNAALGVAMSELALSHPDILIRTSGEIRLSDFIPTNIGHCHVAFVDEYWPEFCLRTFLKVVLDYQCSRDRIEVAKRFTLNKFEADDLRVVRHQEESPQLRDGRISRCCAQLRANRMQFYQEVLLNQNNQQPQQQEEQQKSGQLLSLASCIPRRESCTR